MKQFVHHLRFHRFTIALVAFVAGLCAFVVHNATVLAAITCCTAHNLLRLGGLGSAPLRLAAVAEEEDVNKQILKSLGEMSGRFKSFDQAMADIKLIKETEAERNKQLSEIQKQMLAFQKHQIEKTGAMIRRSHDGISDDCARYLGACYLAAGLRQAETIGLKSSVRDLFEREVKSILGIEAKTALSTSDIPLPTQYSGDIVELVYQYGDARKWATVYPLGAGTVKLPQLGTDPTFTLNAISASITEKSPTVTFATLTAEKFGGLVRLPNEIDEDSIVAMGQFLARYIARNMALCEDYQLFRSTGAASGVNGTAEGLTKSVVTNSKFVYNGDSSISGKTKQSEATLADFRLLRTKPDGTVLARGAYYVHHTYDALFASFNTGTNLNVYQRMGVGGPSLDGYPIRWTASMPAYSTSASVSLVHALFGDLSFAYLGVRGGPRVDTSREAGFTTDEILIRALQRMTTAILATGAIAGLRNAAS